MSLLLSVLPSLLPPLTLLPVPACNSGLREFRLRGRGDTQGREGGLDFPFYLLPIPGMRIPPGMLQGLGGHRRQGRGWRARCHLRWPGRAELGRVGCCRGGIFPWGGI